MISAEMEMTEHVPTTTDAAMAIPTNLPAAAVAAQLRRAAVAVCSETKDSASVATTRMRTAIHTLMVNGQVTAQVLPPPPPPLDSQSCVHTRSWFLHEMGPWV